MAMSGRVLVGDVNNRDRVDNDFYATPQESVLSLLSKEELIFPVLEPACGMGHISETIEQFYNQKVISTDLVYRGYGIGNIDFLNTTYFNGLNINTVITNPPFSLFTEFVQRGLEIANKKLVLFGKIQALEGVERATLLENSPLRTIYVFKKRQNPLRNGSPVDEKGKKWASTMCFAWFVWEKTYKGKPFVEWL